MLATLRRTAAELADETVAQPAYLDGYRQAVAAREHAIEAAEKGGVNNVNTGAYVRATHEAGRCALALGMADASAEGTRLLSEAADFFGEAAAGHRRLGSEDGAKLAGIQAVEARSRRALRE